MPLAPGAESLYKAPNRWELVMIIPDSPEDMAKCVAAKQAAALVENGMRVGLGTGSTAAWLLRHLGERVRCDGLTFKAVATSAQTAALAGELGLEISPLDEVRWLDITIDGADEVDGALTLIKGGGGALLHEKIVAMASDRMVVIADASKAVDTLGAFPLPVEVIRFGWPTTKALVEEMLHGLDVDGRTASLRRRDGVPFVTDEGNYILDLHLRRIGDARRLAMLVNQVPGVVENGLFIDVCDLLILGHGDGRVSLRDIHGENLAVRAPAEDLLFESTG